MARLATRPGRSLTPAAVAGVIVAGLCLVPAGARGQPIQFTEVTRFNLPAVTSAEASPGVLNPNYIGNTAAAVAWNGSRLFVAGFRNGSAVTTTGIIEILNTSTTGVVTSTGVQYGRSSAYESAS